MKKEPKYIVGDSVKVLSGPEELITFISEVKWNHKYEDYIYWFKDNNGEYSYEFEGAIEPTKELPSVIVTKEELTLDEIKEKFPIEWTQEKLESMSKIIKEESNKQSPERKLRNEMLGYKYRLQDLEALVLIWAQKLKRLKIDEEKFLRENEDMSETLERTCEVRHAVFQSLEREYHKHFKISVLREGKINND